MRHKFNIHKQMINTIAVKLDVTKIEKERLFKGKKGTYLDLVLIPTPQSEYGHDFMAVQSVSKEEREAGKRGNILGNATILHRKDAPHENKPTQNQPKSSGDNQDDIPF